MSCGHLSEEVGRKSERSCPAPSIASPAFLTGQRTLFYLDMSLITYVKTLQEHLVNFLSINRFKRNEICSLHIAFHSTRRHIDRNNFTLVVH